MYTPFQLKQVLVTTISLSVAAVAISGGMLVAGNNFKLYNPSDLNPDSLIEFGITNLETSRMDNNASGYPGTDLTFEFDSPKTKDSVNPEALLQLGIKLNESVNYEPALYNVSGVAYTDAKAVDARFGFDSVSPADYTDGTFRRSSLEFNSIMETANFDQTTYDSDVDSSGQRFTTIEGIMAEDESFSALTRSWNQLLQNLNANTQNHTIVLKTADENFTVTGSYLTTEDKDILAKAIPESRWGTFDSLRQQNDLQIQSMTYQVAHGENNRSVLSIIVPDSVTGSEAVYIETFMDRVNKTPAIALPDTYTVTLSTENGKTPFHVITPSNDERRQ